MQNYLFISPSSINEEVFSSMKSLDSVCEEYFIVLLENNEEFEVLLNLLGLYNFIEENLKDSASFSNLTNISKCKLPEFSQEEFNSFYDSWLLRTGRESSMDEYGQLVFILGKFHEWNQRLHKVILQERP